LLIGSLRRHILLILSDSFVFLSDLELAHNLSHLFDFDAQSIQLRLLQNLLIDFYKLRVVVGVVVAEILEVRFLTLKF